MLNLQPDLSGNPFLRLVKLRQKDWERKAEKLPKNIKNGFESLSLTN